MTVRPKNIITLSDFFASLRYNTVAKMYQHFHKVLNGQA